MKNLIKYLLCAVVILMNSDSLIGQVIDYSKPPSQENTYLFKVLKYHRQPAPPKYMKSRIAEVNTIPTSKWTAQDSLFYAYENVHLEEFEMALSIFSRVNIDTIQEPHAQMLYRTTLQSLERYEMLKKFNEKNIPDDPTSVYSIKQAVLDLNNAYIAYKRKTYIPDSTLIFPILENAALEKMNPKKSPNKNKLVEIAFAIDSAFRHFTVLHDEKDYVLSQAFEEMGDFQRDYFYLTNALFYYAGSRHYYVTDKLVIEKYNKVAKEMSEYNYISISFKNKFGKIINNRYRMNTELNESIDSNNLVTPADYTAPPKKKGQKDYLPWIDNSILIMIILGLALVFVLFFMKTKK
ncbi:hypothetical protein [Brumimicrobium oceani]|uniref:Uncharacterized protein n=1 Tax=Brumimicrobium oceani TaxID=2100725 RepID=A0A2U2XGV9_9FLAO|nr:hypothetical protein [Brumimicrobium oceani]PWH86987.1 hypothetical protein DIT68_01640 [Brumimicrobium oceani]